MVASGCHLMSDKSTQASSPPGLLTMEQKIAAAANGAHRSAKNIARNAYRHPVETLSFFDIEEKVVWGATAMMLNEIKDLINMWTLLSLKFTRKRKIIEWKKNWFHKTYKQNDSAQSLVVSAA